MEGHENCPARAWQWVTCDRCGAHYRCTPSQDFYCAAEGDHCCEPCLVAGIGARYDVINHVEVTP